MAGEPATATEADRLAALTWVRFDGRWRGIATPEAMAESAEWARTYLSKWNDYEEAHAFLAGVLAERERCARMVEEYNEMAEDGKHVRPGLGYWGWVGHDDQYLPSASAIAAAIRRGATP